MSLLRYNWLRRLGYRTINGSNYRDPDFGTEWTELIMSNGSKLKHVKIECGTTWRGFQEMESNG